MSTGFSLGHAVVSGTHGCQLHVSREASAMQGRRCPEVPQTMACDVGTPLLCPWQLISIFWVLNTHLVGVPQALLDRNVDSTS